MLGKNHKKQRLKGYYFVENGVVIFTTDLYDLAYDYMCKLLDGKIKQFIDTRDTINGDIVIRDFGHINITLHFSYKHHYKKRGWHK